MDAVSKAGGIVLRPEEGGEEEKFPGREGKYLKIPNVLWPVGNSGTVSGVFL